MLKIESDRNLNQRNLYAMCGSHRRYLSAVYITKNYIFGKNYIQFKGTKYKRVTMQM